MTENKESEEASAPTPPIESSTVMDLILPFRVLVSPLRTFEQLAQRSTAKGLITLAALILVVATASQYATATKIFLTVDSQPTSFVRTDSFASWFPSILATTGFSIILYWLVSASGIALLGRFFGGKEVKLRNSLVIFAYLLSVLVVLYAVRLVTYLALPPITFGIGSWPPVDPTAIDDALSLISQQWGSLFVYQFGSYFTFVAFVWLILLGMVAVKTMRDISWSKASLVSVAGFMITVLLFGLP